MHRLAGYCFTWLYFLTGTAVGAIGIDRSVFKTDGALAKHWWEWVAVGLMSFTVFVVMIVVVTPMERTIVSEIAFVVSCWAIVSGMTGFFSSVCEATRAYFRQSERKFIRDLYCSLCFCYLASVLVVGKRPCSLMKGIVVFVGTLILSWVLVAFIRHIPAIAKII